MNDLGDFVTDNGEREQSGQGLIVPIRAWMIILLITTYYKNNFYGLRVRFLHYETSSFH